MLKQMEDEAKEEARLKEEKKVAAKERQGKKAFDESGVRSVMEPAQKEKADTCEKKGKELQKECLDLISEVKGDSQLAEMWSAMQGMELLSGEYCFICDSVLQAVDLVAWVVATAGRFPSPARSQLVSWFAMEQMLAMQCCIAGASAATQPGEVSQMSSTAQPLFLDQQLYSFSDAWESSEIPYA